MTPNGCYYLERGHSLIKYNAWSEKNSQSKRLIWEVIST